MKKLNDGSRVTIIPIMIRSTFAPSITKAEARQLVEVLGIFTMFGFTVFAYLTWFLAFLSGGRAWIHVNVVGEMYVEYLLWLVVTALVTLSFYYYLTGENRTPSVDS